MDAKARKEKQRRLCHLVEEGMTLSRAANSLGVEHRTVNRWRERYPAFAVQLSRAIDAGLEVLADSLLDTMPDDVVDKESHYRERLRSDNAKWLLERRARARYSPQMNINVHHQVSVRANLEAAMTNVLSLPSRYPEQGQRVIDAEYKRINEDVTLDEGSEEGAGEHVESDDDFKV